MRFSPGDILSTISAVRPNVIVRRRPQTLQPEATHAEALGIKPEAEAS